jgi:hypothetical protein
MRSAIRTWRVNRGAAVFDFLGFALYASVVYLLISNIITRRWIGAGLDAVVLAVWSLWIRYRIKRLGTDLADLRRDLLTAARKIRRDEVWLNRDEHLIFMRDRNLGGVQLRVMNEDDFHDMEAGRTPVIVTSYLMMHVDAGIMRQVDGIIGEIEDGEPVFAPDRKSELRRYRDAWRILSASRKGLTDPDPGELRPVIAALRDAELIGNTRKNN